MSVRTYQNEGKTFYKVYVHVKSNVDPSIRVQRNRSGYKTYTEAVKDERKLQREALKRLTILEEKGSSWAKVIDLWEHEQAIILNYQGGVSKQSVLDYCSMLRRWTRDWLKKNPAELIRADGIEVLKRAELEGRSKGFIQKLKNTINVIYTWGLDNRYIHGVSVSPVQGIKLIRKDDKVPEILTLTEIRKLLYEAKFRGHEWYPVWAMALLTGMRNGELFSLHWDDVDFENQLIRISKSYNKTTKSFKSTKAGYWRNVPISEELKGLLVELKSQTGDTQFVLPRFREWERGEQSKHLRAFLRDIGITPVKFHTLRACFATQLLADGVECSKVMKVGGWKDLKTMQIYMRLAGVDERGATSRLKFLPNIGTLCNHVVDFGVYS